MNIDNYNDECFSLRQDCDYLDVFLGNFTYIWNTTLHRLEAVYGAPDSPNPDKRDQNYARGWFAREDYAQVNPDHASINTGHVVARNLGGMDHGINFIRQVAKINSGQYLRVENMARSPYAEYIYIKLRYEGAYENTQIPNFIDFSIKYTSGFQTHTIRNPVPLARVAAHSRVAFDARLHPKAALLYKIMLREYFPRIEDDPYQSSINSAERERLIEILAQLTVVKTEAAQEDWLKVLSENDYSIVVRLYADLLDFEDLPHEACENIDKIRNMMDASSMYHAIFSRSRD
jgi:hypothetical protein